MSQDVNPNHIRSSLVIFMYWACERQGRIFLVLRSKSSSCKCAILYTVAISNNRDHLRSSLYFCLFASHIFVRCSLRTSRLWWIALSTQHQLRGCKNIHSFLQWPHLLHILFVKVVPGTTFTSWSQHHFVVIVKAGQQVCKASHCGSNMDVRRNFSRGGKVDISLILLRLLMMQRKWAYTKCFILSTPQRKCPMLRQQLHAVFPSKKILH